MEEWIIKKGIIWTNDVKKARRANEEENVWDLLESIKL